MIHFDLPKQKSSIIKVLGVGGGGSNAVNFMFEQDIEGVDFVICNTDAKAIEQSKVHNKIQLGPHLTQGLGAGANPEVGKQATEESLDEIRRILEVNTKMAFITAGMGGGTGTGGAPIIAKICRDLGILTVGIVTTPFSFEGPRRLKQAEEGIRQLQPYVDTLLVISNDKLRMQYGNLKMTEAFGKADNVLATAAKCITDIINSRGTIIVDFADVCTVMKNGGVAILGNATAEGEDRAQKAIEESLNSPLLNDSDIRGAKWILVNINSAEGEHECTMDEFEIINNHLRLQSGEHADLIIGTGYDNTLGNKIGITVIATGFEFKDPFAKKEPVVIKEQPKTEEKIVMTLGIDGEEKKMYNQQPLPFVEKEETDPYAPTIMEQEEVSATPMFTFTTPVTTTAPVPEETVVHFELEMPAAIPVQETAIPVATPVKEVPTEPQITYTEREEPVNKPMFMGSSLLNKPKNIYASEPQQSFMQTPVPAPQPIPAPVQQTVMPAYTQPPVVQKATEPVAAPQPEMFIREEPVQVPVMFVKEEPTPEDNTAFTLVVKEEQAPKPMADAYQSPENNSFDEEQDQRKRATERINKLRNLSFNMNSKEANNEYDNVPAYVRRNMELFGNTLTSAEQFYSKYTVKKNENDDTTNLSSFNSFLEGKKPD
jgi:cell division protein FtsZ